MEPVNSTMGASHTAEVGVCRAVYRSQVPDLDVKQPSLSTLFILFLCLFFVVVVVVVVIMALSTVFHSINSSNNAPLSYSVLLVLFLPYWSFQLHICT